MFYIWGWLNSQVRNSQIQRTMEIERPQIFVSMVDHRTSPSWIPGDDCRLFTGWEKKENAAKLNYITQTRGWEREEEMDKQRDNIREWKTSESVCGKRKHSVLLDFKNLIFFNSSKLPNEGLECLDELCCKRYLSFWIQDSWNKDLTKGSCYRNFQIWRRNICQRKS